MDNALKIGKLIAYAAETILASCMVAETIETFRDRKKSAKENDKEEPAEEAVPSSN